MKSKSIISALNKNGLEVIATQRNGYIDYHCNSGLLESGINYCSWNLEDNNNIHQIYVENSFERRPFYVKTIKALVYLMTHHYPYETYRRLFFRLRLK